jgi:hypothetical protein
MPLSTGTSVWRDRTNPAYTVTVQQSSDREDWYKVTYANGDIQNVTKTFLDSAYELVEAGPGFHVDQA